MTMSFKSHDSQLYGQANCLAPQGSMVYQDVFRRYLGKFTHYSAILGMYCSAGIAIIGLLHSHMLIMGRCVTLSTVHDNDYRCLLIEGLPR